MLKKFLTFKKIIFGSLVALVILPFVFKPTLAFETPNPTYQFQFEEAIKSEEMNLQSFVNETIKAIMGSIVHFIMGTFSPTNNSEVGFDLSKPNIQAGLLPAGMSVLSNIYSYPPASGINYFAQKAKDLKIIKSTYAQDERMSGFQAFQPLQTIWTTFRNFAYLFFVLILIGIGFAIMFRLKISPQAVVSFQSALPRIVISLILITFSYAIVGLIFDIMGFINLAIQSIFTDLNFGGPVFGPHTGWADLAQGLKGFVEGLTPSTLQFDPITGPPHDLFQQALVGFFLFQAYIFLLFPVIGLIANLIVAVIVLIAFARCLWVIIKSFAMIIINLIFGPFRIMIGVLPGNNSIAEWFKDLISNAAVLPTMLIFFGISTHLIFSGVGLSTDADWWRGILQEGTDFLPSKNLIPITVRAILPFCGIAILLMAPKVSEVIQSFITKKPFDYGSAIGEFTGVGSRMVQKGVSTFNEKSGRAIRSEGERKAKIEVAAEKYRNEHPTR